MATAIESIPLATADYQGERWEIAAIKHDAEWPGTESSVTFGVYRYEMRENVWVMVEGVGFFSETDCYSYLTGAANKKYDIFDGQGNADTVVRKGRRIPASLIVKDILEIT